MVIDEQTGTIVWQPTANQIGDTTVSVQVTDIYGAYNVQEFTIHVKKLYWELFGKILEQVRQLPPETKITKIEIQE
ncbi:putative Ig domain-containing protein [uncultured Nostoc sp.]|uniref:putative Ig domain-containing protein n=1 Tax=uncultured Nostoc sp. TaxID=340711 RepID=UPI0035C9E06D